MNFRHVFPSEHQDESIFVFVRSYFLAFLPSLLIGITLLIIGVAVVIIALVTVPDLVGSGLGYNIFVVFSSAYFLMILAFTTVVFISFYYDIHVVTDRRLVDIDQHNLFSREVNELALENVQDVTTRNRSVFSSVFDFGDVIIETASSTQKFEFNSILHPREIAAIILDLSDQAKQRIESGSNDTHIFPRTAAKGVIEAKIYSSTDPLVEMGAIVPHDPAMHEKTTEVNDQATTVKQSVPTKPLPTPPIATSTQAANDLDIVIDDPINKRPKK